MADDSSPTDTPHLSAFLQVRLVELGLDYDTYGPYVLGIEVGNDNDEEAQEEIEQVCQLLQASSESETYADDDAIWVELGQQILHHMQLDNDDKLAMQQAIIQFEKQQLQDQLALAKQEQQVDNPKHETTTTTTASSSTSKSSIDDAAKKAMLQRFAYEQDDDGIGGATGDEGSGVVTNKQVAQQVNMAKAQELKSKKGVHTKREEQIKTKDDRANKAQAKEDRKKRAVKGERKA